MPPERLIGNSDGRPRFPFVDIAHCSPRTPMRKSQPSLLYDVAQTHPIDNPFYPSPFYGLSFNKGSSGALSREGALIPMSFLCSPKEPAITYFKVKHVYIPKFGTFRGQKFRPIDVGLRPKDKTGDVDFQVFDPGFIRTYWALRHKSDCIPGPEQESGLTAMELRQICVQCVLCERFVSRVSHHYHQCPEANIIMSEDVSKEDDAVHSLEFRLDAMGKGYLLWGLAKAEFEQLFCKCMGCARFLTTSGRFYHVCSFNPADAIPDTFELEMDDLFA